jgi:hypothetical protein
VDSPALPRKRGQGGKKLFPPEVGNPGAGQTVKDIRFNNVNYPPGLPVGGHPIDPSPGIRCMGIKPEDFIGQGIPVMKITKKPPVKSFVPNGFLNSL